MSQQQHLAHVNGGTPGTTMTSSTSLSTLNLNGGRISGSGSSSSSEIMPADYRLVPIAWEKSGTIAKFLTQAEQNILELFLNTTVLYFKH